jgi:hypothetical protein
MKMKNYSMKYKIRMMVVALMVTAGTLVHAQTYTENQKIERSFPANSETRLEISNKYGTVHIIPWREDSVHIEIDLFVKSSSNSKLEKLLRNIDFEFTDTRYYIVATTSFGNKYNTFFSDLKDISGSIIPSKNQVEINYTVHVPSGMNVNISNKYGDIYIDDMKGSVSINLSNGDLKANSLYGDANISLNFGNGIINELGNARMNISYADIEIRKVDQLNIESKSSYIRIQEAGILKTNSRRDKYTINRIGNLFGESWFSDILIYRMDEEINYSPSYGNLSLDTIPSGFSFINVNTQYSDLNMHFDAGASYILEVIRHDQVVLRIPEEYGDLEITPQEDETAFIRGLIGNDSNPSSRVKITAPKKCFISIHKL